VGAGGEGVSRGPLLERRGMGGFYSEYIFVDTTVSILSC
jgi:hypothetical protein